MDKERREQPEGEHSRAYRALEEVWRVRSRQLDRLQQQEEERKKYDGLTVREAARRVLDEVDRR